MKIETTNRRISFLNRLGKPNFNGLQPARIAAFIVALYLFIFNPVFSQNDNAAVSTIQGKITDEKKMPIAFVSVIINGTKTGTQTDSTGFFILKVKPGATLLLSKVGYDDMAVVITGRDSYDLVLKTKDKLLKEVSVSGGNSSSAAARTATLDEQMAGHTLQEYRTSQNLSSGPSVIEGVKIGSDGPPELIHILNTAPTGQRYTGVLLPVFSTKEETRGSRYLFTKWAHGTVTEASGRLDNDNSFLFNYDKINSKLLFTIDKATVIEIDYDAIQSFTLTDGVYNYSFVKDPFTDKKKFIQELNEVKGKYSFFKRLKTHFEKSNYVSTGMVESGNKYDEFVDEKEYFIFSTVDKQLQKISFKKKSIEDVFFKEQKLMKKYFSDHRDDEIDEVFLTGLVNFINTPAQQ